MPKVSKRSAVVLSSVLLVALAVVGGIWVSAAAKKMAVEALSRVFGHPAEVADAKLHLFPPSLTLSGVSIEPSPYRRVSIERVDVALSSGSLHSFFEGNLKLGDISVDGLELHVELVDGALKTPLKERAPSAESEGPKKVSVPPIEAVTLRSGAVHLWHKGKAVSFNELNGRAEGTADGLTAFLTARPGDEKERVRIGIGWDGRDLSGTMQAESLGLAFLTALHPKAKAALEKSNVSGSLEFRGRVSSLEGHVQSQAFGRKKSELWIRATRHGSKVRVSAFTATMPGFEGSGAVSADLDSLELEADLEGEKLDVPKIIAQVTPLLSEGDGGGGAPWLEAWKGRADAKFEKVGFGPLEGRALRGKADLSRGLLTLSNVSGKFYGGKLFASKATIKLSSPKLPWRLRAAVDDVKVGEAVKKLFPDTVVDGRVAAEIELRGEGFGDETPPTFNGKARVAARKVMVPSPFEGSSAPVQITDLSGRVKMGGGKLSLDGPLSGAGPFGQLTATGELSLKGALALDLTVLLSPAFIPKATKKKLDSASPLEARVQVRGNVDAPEVKLADVGTAVESLLVPRARKATARRAEGLEKRARDERSKLEREAEDAAGSGR